MSSIFLTDFNTKQILELVTGLGMPSYRAKQLQHWLYQGLALSYDEMSELPKHFRQKLTQQVLLHKLNPQQEVTSSDGTVKILFKLPDEQTIETTLMPYQAPVGKKHYTICISTQVGCAIGCPFCATGQQGFVRNLTSGEIIDQVLFFARRLRDHEPKNKISNLVFMGMGEPLANYGNLWAAIEMLNAADGFGLGARNMTISTAGLIPQLKRLSNEKLQVGLAVSLHAATNELRDRLVPLNKRYPLEKLIPACREYVNMTGRRITFEYILIEDVNDSLIQARQLAHLIAGLNCHVNLIAANRTLGGDLRPASSEAVFAFEAELKRLHIQCTVRQSRGLDINAGCGQLRSRHVDTAPSSR